jgi:hypothetical protein
MADPHHPSLHFKKVGRFRNATGKPQPGLEWFAVLNTAAAIIEVLFLLKHLSPFKRWTTWSSPDRH